MIPIPILEENSAREVGHVNIDDERDRVEGSIIVALNFGPTIIRRAHVTIESARGGIFLYTGVDIGNQFLLPRVVFFFVYFILITRAALC